MNTLSLKSSQISVLVILRVLIGWHFLYEGVVKFGQADWTARGYLSASEGWFAGIFQSMAGNPAVMGVVDILNVWGLILVGLALILGAFTRYAAIGGIVLLSLYYLAQPPVIGSAHAAAWEGSYLWVNKNLIEIFALAVLLVFPSGQEIGLDRFFGKSRR